MCRVNLSTAVTEENQENVADSLNILFSALVVEFLSSRQHRLSNLFLSVLLSIAYHSSSFTE